MKQGCVHQRSHKSNCNVVHDRQSVNRRYTLVDSKVPTILGYIYLYTYTSNDTVEMAQRQVHYSFRPMTTIPAGVGLLYPSGTRDCRRRGQKAIASSAPRLAKISQLARWRPDRLLLTPTLPTHTPPPNPATPQLSSYRAQTTHGPWITLSYNLYVVFSAICARHHASRASRSAIVRAFHRTYIITGDPRNTSELRERPIRLRLMLPDCPVRTSSRRIAHHDRQRTPSISHHEAAFTGRTL